MRYGPPGGRRLVYFVDDMNMPFVDKYDTQSAIELLRQMIDYHGWCVRVCVCGWCVMPRAACCGGAREGEGLQGGSWLAAHLHAHIHACTQHTHAPP